MPHTAISGPLHPAGTAAEASPAPPRTRRDPALDGLRGLAVLMVFLFHYGGGLQSSKPAVRLLGYVTQGSWLGVVLFFALSGFLITGSLWDSLGQRHRLRNFYIRRALRIFPLYFLALAAAALYALHRGASLVSLKPLAVFVFFLQDFPHLSSYALQIPLSLPLYHLWTVAVEEQFYLIWPIVLLFAHSRRHALRISLWIFGISALFLYIVYTLPPFEGARTHHLYDYFLLTQAGPIALGAAVSLAMGSRIDSTGRKPGSHRVIRKYARPAFLAGCGIYLYTSYISKTLYLSDPIQFWLGLPAIAVAAAAMIPLVLRPGLLRTIFSNDALGWMGRISYGFYIYHILLEPLFDHIGRVIAHTNTGEYYQIVRLVFAFPISCLVAWLSFHLYELPILNLKRFFPMSSSLPWGEPVAPTHSSRQKRHRSRHSSRPT
jgi:peptidoglycan/LPS O-acetylase OafA/YrhL